MYIAVMLVIACRFIFLQNDCGIAIWPFIILKSKSLKNNTTLLNHEKIHLRQQIELLILPFYIWYTTEYLIKLVKYKDHNKAYCNISFEKEAYYYENNFNYLKTRKLWAFWKHL